MLEGGAAGRLVPRPMVTGLDRPHSWYFIFILKKKFLPSYRNSILYMHVFRTNDPLHLLFYTNYQQ